jgi:Peptidase propeptide and YPEB domain
MRIQLLALALIAAAATSAHADDLLNQGKALLGTQGNAVPSASGQFAGLPTDKIIELVEKQGYSQVSGLGLDGNVLKATALNKSGSPVDLLIEPSTGNVLQALTK